MHTSNHHLDDHDDFGGAARDLPRLISRRSLLGFAGAGLGALALAACGGSDSASTATVADTTGATTAATDAASTSAAAIETTAAAVDTTAAAAATGAADLAAIPGETAGPYPGDGSNGPDILAESGVVRSDITASIGSASGVAEGVPLTVTLTIVDEANDGAPIPGAAVYLWHATREGEYSMYSANVVEENFLRGVQEADANGTLTFQTIFPGCYDGRWPHIHFEVYDTLADTIGGSPRITSQLAMPEESCATAYTADGYSTSASNLSRTSLSSDMVFRDGADLQLPTMSGDATSGFVAELTVAV